MVAYVNQSTCDIGCIDAQSSDAGTIGCRIPSRNIELMKDLTVLGNHLCTLPTS